jgi:hypothetical protein
MLETNVGTANRLARAAIGILLIIVGFHNLDGVVGTIILSTAIIGSCPSHSMFARGARSGGEASQGPPTARSSTVTGAVTP